MRTLVTADLQWSDHRRDEYRHLFVEQLLDLISEYEIDMTYILGDLTEQKDRHSAVLVNKVTRHLYRISLQSKLKVMRGNHDYQDINSPFFEFTKYIANISWINKPTVADNSLFLPHTRDYKRDWDIEMDGYPFIFTHNIFTGVTANGVSLKGIPMSVFPTGSKVISGDVHEPQAFGCVTYVGSPYLCDFGDDYEPRVLLIDDEKVKSIPVDGPQKRLVETRWPMKINQTINRGDILKIRITLTMKQSAKWSEIRDSLEQWADKNRYIIDSAQPFVEFEAREELQKARQIKRKSDHQYVHAYAKRNGLDQKLLDFGLDFIGDEDS